MAPPSRLLIASTAIALFATLITTAFLQPNVAFRLVSRVTAFSIPKHQPFFTKRTFKMLVKTPPQAPPTFKHTAESIVSEAKALIERSRALQDGLVKDISPDNATFESVIAPLAQDEIAFTDAFILGFYQHVSTDKAVRDASSEAEKLLDDFSIESGMREDVFKLVHAVAEKEKSGSLSPEAKRLLEKMDRDYVRNGLLLDEKQRERFKELKKELSVISIEFAKNVGEEVGGLWFTAEELDGLPKDVLDGLKNEEKDGKTKYFLTRKYPDLFPALKFIKNQEVRKQIFIANENKVPQNLPLFNKGVRIRYEIASMLGFENYAAFNLDVKMAKNVTTVNKFLQDLKEKLEKGGLEELERLKKLKKDDVESRGEKFDGRYWFWDHRYYDRLLVEKEYEVDELKIAEYFPFDKAVRGMFQVFETLFGLEFVKPTTKGEVGEGNRGWHEDCLVFEVWDKEEYGGEFVGYLYLDVFPREGKYGHAANFGLRPGYLRDPKDGSSRHYPSTALVCNFSKATASKPSLLKHDELVTFFHELGHGIHDLVSKTTYSRFHGTNVVRDFVEAPSQMLENWCWEQEQLRAFSSHYQTHEPLPDELIKKMIAAKHVNGAQFNLRQLFFGMFDMRVHTMTLPHDEALDSTVTYNKMRREICRLDAPEDDGYGMGQTSFGHLFGGYSAGYYGYLWSQVFSADMFATAFKKAPMDREAGRRYRKMILEKGGSEEEMDILKAFLGREPNSDAFLEELGLKK